MKETNTHFYLGSSNQINNKTPKAGSKKPYNIFPNRPFSIETLVKWISKGNAYAICPFENGLRAKEEKGASYRLLHADIDGSKEIKDENGNKITVSNQKFAVTIEFILGIFAEYELEPTIVATHSYTDEMPSWRILLPLAISTFEPEKFMKMQKMFSDVFTANGIKLDPTVVEDYNRIYFGNSKLSSDKHPYHIGQPFANITTIQALPSYKSENIVPNIPKTKSGSYKKVKAGKEVINSIPNRRLMMFEEMLSYMPKNKSETPLKPNEWWAWFYGARNWFGMDTRILNMIIEHYEDSDWSHEVSSWETSWYVVKDEEQLTNGISTFRNLNHYSQLCGYSPSHFSEIFALQPTDTFSSNYVSDGFRLDDTKITLLRSRMGSGKTHNVIELVKSGKYKRILLVSHRVKLLKQIYKKFDSSNLGFEIYDDKELGMPLPVYDRLIITHKSLPEVANNEYDLVIFDEFQQILEDFSSDNDSYWKDGEERVVYDAIYTVMENSKQSLLLDATADITSQRDVLRNFDSEDVRVVENTNTGTLPTIRLTTNKAEWANEILRVLDNDDRTIIIMDNKSEAERLAYVIEKSGHDTLIISQEPENKNDQDEFIQNPDEWLKNNSDVLIIGTPTIATGIDIQTHFDAVFVGIYGVMSLSSSLQMTARARQAKNCFTYINPKFYTKPDTQEAIEEFLERKLEDLYEDDNHNVAELIMDLRVRDAMCSNESLYAFKSFAYQQGRVIEDMIGGADGFYDEVFKDTLKDYEIVATEKEAQSLLKADIVSFKEWKEYLGKNDITNEIWYGYKKYLIEGIYKTVLQPDEFGVVLQQTEEQKLEDMKAKITLYRSGFHDNGLLFMALLNNDKTVMNYFNKKQKDNKVPVVKRFNYRKAFSELKTYFDIVLKFDWSNCENCGVITRTAKSFNEAETKRVIKSYHNLGMIYGNHWSGKQVSRAVTSVLNMLSIDYKNSESRGRAKYVIDMRTFCRNLRWIRNGVIAKDYNKLKELLEH